MVSLFYTTYIGVDRAHHEIFRAKVGKGGKNVDKLAPKVLVTYRKCEKSLI